MKKVILIIMTVLLVVMSATACTTNKEEKNNDALKFKEEYESLNGKENASSLKHRDVTIPEDNPFIYITGEELVQKIENKETFYVYFGSSYCPWCRSVIEKAIEVAKNKGINQIYYVNIWDGDHVEIFRDTYTLNDDGEVTLVKDGTEAYKKVIDYFSDVLGEYTLTDKDGNTISVGEKRIFAPNFVYVENGKAVRLEAGESDKQQGSRDELTEEMLKDEEEKFDQFFVESAVCTQDKNC